MPVLNAVTKTFFGNIVYPNDVGFRSNIQVIADLRAKPQEVLAAVWDGRMLADHELDVRSVQLRHDTDDAVMPLGLVPIFICVQ